METNIIQLHELDKYKKLLGNKTLNLKKCVDWGFNVPKFIALPSSLSKKLLNKKVEREKIAREIINILPSKKYAVRSSALMEDSKRESLAGQFLTKTKVNGKELGQCMYEVLKQAEVYLKGEVDKFSIIIQEYISPDVAGVTFTRNPNGNREMLIEYGFCEGEKIVSGEIKPQKISFYWNNDLLTNLSQSYLTHQIIEKFKEIERKNNFPQDIEWCITKNTFYVLQTRPITTLSKKQYEQILFLEEKLPKNAKYYFEKTEISEIAQRPSTVTFDLLKFIYAKNGPVWRVYKKYKINYQDTDFLKIIGNELYVDKEKEIQGLLPAYSYSNNKNTPKLSKISKILPTIKNLFLFNKIKTNDYEKLYKDLKTKIEEKQNKVDLKTALKKLLNDYEIIFETNLLSGLSIKKLNAILRKKPVNFLEIINSRSLFIDTKKYQVQYPKNLRGNSLEISDQSIFMANQNTKNKTNNTVKKWWQKTSEYKKKILQNKIIEAIIYNRLRELGRWLTIKNINILRNILLDYAKDNKFKDLNDIFFVTFDDILNGRIDEIRCVKNKNSYKQYNHFNLPNSITSSLINTPNKKIGVSAGLARGILQNREAIKNEGIKNKKVILYTEVLSPDLTQYFDKISGIVAHNGALLSHLAIVAREKNIPVIVGFSISDEKIKIGDNVQIDGNKGEISKIIP